MYNVLAKFYDDLVKDDDATKAWVDLIQQYTCPSSLLELACGSAEITIALANLGYQIDASDLSEEMLIEAKQKDIEQKINFFQMDMCHINLDKTYEVILCLCDSINYLIKDKDVEHMISQVYDRLDINGIFIFDMHSMDRLTEFEEEFYEAGVIDKHEYSWSILSEDNYIYHNFCFYDEQARVKQEQHIQKVYTPSEIEEMLSPYFTFEVKTDFIHNGITEGEKYFYICRKKEK